MNQPLVSVIMPTYLHARFIKRSIVSLQAQTLTNWQLIIINDASGDNTYEVVQPFLNDDRIVYLENDQNRGLGFCLNKGIENARSSYIAYLPSDDLYYRDHLQSLYDLLQNDSEATLAYSGLRHYYNRQSVGIINNLWLQLVQTMHRKTQHRWTERNELESDDLNRLFWSKLPDRKLNTGKVSCEWVDHPGQRYKIMQEPIGGINTFRTYYQVKQPLIFHTTRGNYMNEDSRYAGYRNAQYSKNSNGLKILLVGELAYNAERVLALAEQGHTLYGLWMEKPYWYNYVGPLPFNHVQDLDSSNWQEEIKTIKPDIIYALLNWQAVPMCHKVLMANTGIPFVWHFKEGPFICLEKGMFNEMMDLYNLADGRIYNSVEMQWWLQEFISPKPHSLDYVLDGDLPKKDWFNKQRTPLLSHTTPGEFHTVVPGRPIGLHPHNVVELAEHHIHLHFYGDFTQGQWLEWIAKTHRMAPGFLHIHPNVDQENWVEEFSKYDAGWLHYFESENFGEITRANWDDLNIPARLPTLALAGVPVLQRSNPQHIVSIQNIAKQKQLGLFFNNMGELAAQLADKEKMQQLRDHVWNTRDQFTFDYHVEGLVNYFRKVIAACQSAR